MSLNYWTPDECEIVRQHYPAGGSAEVLKLLPNRTLKAVQGQARRLGLPMRAKNWPAEHDELLRQHYRARGGLVVAEMTGRSVVAVQTRARILGVRADRAAEASRRMLAKTTQNNVPHAQTRIGGPALQVKRERVKSRPMLTGDAIITSETKVTIAPPFVDRRWLPDVVVRVVDSSECREWAREATT